jgi:hypothetical protein
MVSRELMGGVRNEEQIDYHNGDAGDSLSMYSDRRQRFGRRGGCRLAELYTKHGFFLGG